MTTNAQYLESTKKLFLYYKTLGEKAMAQLEPGQLFVAANDDTNSIAIIVKHLSGNMLSRWTDFLTSDGEKQWRDRDAEFEQTHELIDANLAQAALMESWEKGWECLFDALKGLAPENLADIVYIRNEGHSIIEAINRQLAHYSYHVGQIVFYAKILKSDAWDSLSIPRNKSNDYNADKFAREKSRGLFTDEEFRRLDNDN